MKKYNTLIIEPGVTASRDVDLCIKYNIHTVTCVMSARLADIYNIYINYRNRDCVVSSYVTPLPKSSYSFIVNLRSLLFIVSCVFKYGLYSLIHRASRVFRWISLFVVLPRMLTCSRVICPSHLARCAFTGPFLKCSPNRSCRCRLVLPT